MKCVLGPAISQHQLAVAQRPFHIFRLTLSNRVESPCGSRPGSPSLVATLALLRELSKQISQPLACSGPKPSSLRPLFSPVLQLPPVCPVTRRPHAHGLVR